MIGLERGGMDGRSRQDEESNGSEAGMDGNGIGGGILQSEKKGEREKNAKRRLRSEEQIRRVETK